jgi:hypothetical protein
VGVRESERRESDAWTALPAVTSADGVASLTIPDAAVVAEGSDILVESIAAVEEISELVIELLKASLE